MLNLLSIIKMFVGERYRMKNQVFLFDTWFFCIEHGSEATFARAKPFRSLQGQVTKYEVNVVIWYNLLHHLTFGML